MKRLWVILGALAVFCALSVGTANAGQVAAHRAIKPLFFDHNSATAVNGSLDSLVASGAAKFDTTQAFATNNLTLPPASSSLDSLVTLRLFVFDHNSGTAATAESIYVKTQVSADGVGWHDVAVIGGQAPVLNAFTVQTTVNAAVLTWTASTNTGIATKMWTLPYYAKINAAGLKHGVDISHVHEFPYVRWILMGSRSLVHQWKASVGYWSTSDLD